VARTSTKKIETALYGHDGVLEAAVDELTRCAPTA
jgi:acyl-coenzyme A synthetase/AMP-(fatty) acid ligase